MLCLSRVLWAAEEVTLRASVDRTTVKVGEPIRYALTLEHPEGVDVSWPLIGSTLGGFDVEVSGAEPSQHARHLVRDVRWYRLASYEAGPRTIPEPTATYRAGDGTDHDVKGPAISVTVASVLPKDWASQDIRGPKGLIRIGSSLWWLWGLGALLCALAGVGWRLARRRRRPEESAPVRRPPHEAALEALDQLRRDDLPSVGRYEEYYVRLSTIVRAYIEARFALRAPEMTTEEFLQATAQAQALTSEQRQLLRQFLIQADLVKFARYHPSGQEANEAFMSAKCFVEETASRISDADVSGPLSRTQRA